MSAEIFITPAAEDATTEAIRDELLKKHRRGYPRGGYLHTELKTESGLRVWAITEAGATTILLPEDY